MLNPSKVIAILMVFLPLVATTCAYPLGQITASGIDTLVRRGIVSPSSSELLHNTIGFGSVAILTFILRL